MAFKVCVVLALVCFAQLSLGDDAPSPTPPSFQDLIDKANATLSDMISHVRQMVGLPEASSEQILNTMKEETNKLTDRVKAFIENLQKELQKDGSLSGVIEQITSKMNSTLNDLKQNAPDANQLQEKFSKGVQTVIDESKKLSDVLSKEGGEAHEKLKNIVTQTLNQTGTLANEFQEKIHKIVTEKDGEHGHH